MMLRIYFLQQRFNLSDPAGEGGLYDSVIISAPSSTKNKDKTRGPDVHETKKGNQWYFGMKAHIGRRPHQTHPCRCSDRGQR